MSIMVLQVPGFYAGIDEQGKLIELGHLVHHVVAGAGLLCRH